MDNTNRVTEEMTLKDITGKFINSYAERDKNVDFPNWLADQMLNEIPFLRPSASKQFSDEIIEGVAEYDRALGELNKAIETGQSKEGWLADRLTDTYVDMQMDDAGSRLLLIESDLNISNSRLMGDSVDVLGVEVVDWNEYSLKNKAIDVGKQAVMSGLNAAMATVKKNMESGEASDISEGVGQALQDGIKASKGEVKAVVAGAIKTAAEKGLTDILTSDTPTETICGIAGVAVESAQALFDVANGKSTIVEALDKMGRASVTAVCRMGANVIKGTLAGIPVVGPVVVNLAGGLLEHMKSPKFNENVYTVVRDAAKATWEGIKAVGRCFLNRLMNTNTVKESE